ncbi:MAG: glycerate kinase [Desulfobulbaceae bacterium]|nr:glycerate kinase [Desulfobulbaceae bacterium]
MKIVIAPNAFKGSMTAAEAARAMATGIKKILPDAEVVQVPVADGGDGLVEIANQALQGEIRKLLVTGPCFDLVEAQFCLVPSMQFAAIEMALASGIVLLPNKQRDPTKTTTFGTGELIAAALDLGVRRIAVGIGGSATNDGGIGMAAALGVRFLNANGQAVKPVGGTLTDIRRIDMAGLDSRINDVRFEVVCDVDNPLIGPAGAAQVYGPQKGATPEQVKVLDQGLANLADVIASDLGFDVRNLAGAGAAGGLGAGLYAFLGAELKRGVDMVLNLVGLDEKLHGADLVLTGEGQIDSQTAFGKAPAGVAIAAEKQNIPCIAIAGSVGEQLDTLYPCGINAVFSLCPGPLSLDQAMNRGQQYLAGTTEQAVRCFLAGQNRPCNQTD